MAKHKLIKKQVSIQDRSERNRVDRKNMIQECKNPIVEDDSHGFLHRNCEGTEQLRKQFYHTVHTVNAQDDTEGQLTVWADGKADLFYYRGMVTVQNRSERNRVDRKNMIQECKNSIVEDDFHGFLHRNCEGTEQFREMHINFAQNNELAFPNNLVSLMKLRLAEKRR